VMALLHVAPGPLIGEVHRFLIAEQLDGRITTPEQARAEVLARFGTPSNRSAQY
jgi:hypothetical protein